MSDRLDQGHGPECGDERKASLARAIPFALSAILEFFSAGTEIPQANSR
jgi:hypothetical protein